ncbi:MAG: metal-dependent transcriptional regulator [Chloroflexi bacterium]|jgi:DtxR family Mn-dependent transcriptional regulator|nr:metal-dependent transcriptional regulator [Chloroflexota bacterium]
MIVNISPASQDYLKVIYDLSEQHGRAATSQIAEQLEIKPASVTGMLQKMAKEDPPLVEYKKHQGVTLTCDGEKAALEIMRHHRLLESFLHEILGYSWDEVHEEAERLEHVISEDMERRIAAVLGNPSRDPHGQPIPTQKLEIQALTDTPMGELRPPQNAIVQRVHDNDPELLRYLADLGLQPGARLTVLAYVHFDQTLHVQIEGREETAVLGPSITGRIFVELEQHGQK